MNVNVSSMTTVSTTHDHWSERVHTKRHLGRCSARGYVRQTDRDHAADTSPSCDNRPHLMLRIAMRHNNSCLLWLLLLY